MGSTFTQPVTNPNDEQKMQNISKLSTVPTEPREFTYSYQYYEISAMKIILKADRSKSAFLKYLDRKGKSCILLWCLDVRELGKIKNEYLSLQINEIRSRFNINQYNGAQSCWQTDVWRSVNETIPECSKMSIDELQIVLSNAESYCLTLLTFELKEFLNSPEFTKTYEFNHHIKDSIIATAELDEELKVKYKNVLIIDDSFTNSQLMTYVMEKHGHHVRQANHGRIGAHLAALSHFDVIFIDLSMTTMNPFEVIKRIRMSQQRMSQVESSNQSLPPQTNSPTVIGWVKGTGQYDLSDYGIDCINIPVITSSYAVNTRTLDLMLREFYHIITLRYEEELYYNDHKQNDTVSSFNSQADFGEDEFGFGISLDCQ